MTSKKKETKRKYPWEKAERNEALFKDKESGMCNAEVSAKYGVGQSSITKIMRRMREKKGIVKVAK